jgi:hypothetical protein
LVLTNTSTEPEVLPRNLVSQEVFFDEGICWRPTASELNVGRIVGQLLEWSKHEIGNRGREQERLPSGALTLPSFRQVRHDLADIRPKAHVQHAVGLVEDEGVEPVEPGNASSKVVQ